MFHFLIALLITTNISAHHITSVNLGQAQIKDDNELAHSGVNTIPVETTSKKIVNKATSVEKPLITEIKEDECIEKAKVISNPVIQTQNQNTAGTKISDVPQESVTNTIFDVPRRLVLPIQLQSDKSEVNLANLQNIPLNDFNLFIPAQNQVYGTKFNYANLQSFGYPVRDDRPVYVTPQFVKYPKPYPAYNLPAYTYSPQGYDAYLASPQLKFKVNQLANIGQSGKY